MADVDTVTSGHVVRIAGICGSLRSGSYTRMALRIALDAAEEAGAQVHLIDLRDYELRERGEQADRH